MALSENREDTKLEGVKDPKNYWKVATFVQFLTKLVNIYY
jgi:hypothetical protein